MKTLSEKELCDLIIDLDHHFAAIEDHTNRSIAFRSDHYLVSKVAHTAYKIQIERKQEGLSDAGIPQSLQLSKLAAEGQHSRLVDHISNRAVCDEVLGEETKAAGKGGHT